MLRSQATHPYPSWLRYCGSKVESNAEDLQGRMFHRFNVKCPLPSLNQHGLTLSHKNCHTCTQCLSYLSVTLSISLSKPAGNVSHSDSFPPPPDCPTFFAFSPYSLSPPNNPLPPNDAMPRSKLNATNALPTRVGQLARSSVYSASQMPRIIASYMAYAFPTGISNLRT